MSARRIFTNAVVLKAEAQLDDVTPAQYCHAVFGRFVDSAPTTSEEFEIWYTYTDPDDSNAVYDTLIYHDDPSTNSDVHIYFGPYSPIPLEKGAGIEVRYQNTDGRKIAVSILVTTRL